MHVAFSTCRHTVVTSLSLSCRHTLDRQTLRADDTLTPIDIAVTLVSRSNEGVQMCVHNDNLVPAKYPRANIIGYPLICHDCMQL